MEWAFFLTAGFLAATSGLALTWIRGSRMGSISALGVTLNGVLIIGAVAVAGYYARNRDFARHSRWAIRAFLLISGVWFFRFTLTAWFLVAQGPVGSTEMLDEPMDLVWSYGSYLISLAVAEFYFRAQRARSAHLKWLAGTVLTLGTIWMAIGTFAAYMMLWAPNMTY